MELSTAEHAEIRSGPRTTDDLGYTRASKFETFRSGEAAVHQGGQRIVVDTVAGMIEWWEKLQSVDRPAQADWSPRLLGRRATDWSLGCILAQNLDHFPQNPLSNAVT